VRSPLVLATALSFVVACSVDSSATLPPTVDSSASDAGAEAAPLDTSVSPEDSGDADADTGSPSGDSGARDADPADADPADPDAGEPDIGPPDVGPPDTGRPTCDELYGSTNGYFLCAERDDECEFFAVLERTSCDDACAAGAVAGTCTGNFGNSSATGPDRCLDSGGSFTCTADYTDHICVCSRP